MRNFLNNMRDGMRRFMSGRYGTDQYEKFLLWVTFILIIFSLFFHTVILETVVILLIIYTYFRMLSRNFSKRSLENERYLAAADKVKGFFSGGKGRSFKDRRTYRYFKCPGCGQQVRVPKGKGHIRITCPKCHTQFERTV